MTRLSLVIFTIIALILLGFNAYFSFLRLKQPNESSIIRIGTCDETALKTAYVERYVAPINCPPYLNELFVNPLYTLFKRPLDDDDSDGCCNFLNDDADFVYVPRPEVCVSTLDGSVFPVKDLNMNPYALGGGFSLTFVKAGEDYAVAVRDTTDAGTGGPNDMRITQGKHAEFGAFIMPFLDNCIVDKTRFTPRNSFQQTAMNASWVPLPASLGNSADIQ